MAMLEEKIIKRIPGNLCPNPKEKQGYIDNLNSKSRVELVELLERQDKLLANKSFINKLPDKGERIKAFRDRVVKALAETDQIDQTCGLLSELSLTKSNVVDEIEWTGKLTGVLNEDSNDSSEEETNPLKILASHSGTRRFKKKNRYKRISWIVMESLSSSDEDLHISAVSWKKVSNSIVKDGFREGVSAGHEKTYQDAFDSGYNQGHCVGRRFGFLKGAFDVLKVHDPTFSTSTEDSFNVGSLHKSCHFCETGKVNQFPTNTENDSSFSKDSSSSGNDSSELSGSKDGFNNFEACNENTSIDHMCKIQSERSDKVVNHIEQMFLPLLEENGINALN